MPSIEGSLLGTRVGYRQGTGSITFSYRITSGYLVACIHQAILAHFAHYLHSNQAPSKDEAQEMKVFSVHLLGDISAVDVEIE